MVDNVVYFPLTHGMFAGILLGSVLEPFLRNLVFDELLKTLDNNVAIKAIAYDSELMCAIQKNECANLGINEVMIKESKWSVSVGPSLAKDKTEIIMKTGRRVRRLLKLMLVEMETQTKRAI